jgi:uncharacterized membrane protein
VPNLPDPDAIGPVDVAVIHFEGNRFNGDVAPALAELADLGIVHIIDLAFVLKDEDGSVTTIEVEDSEVAEAFAGLSDDHVDLLSDEDLEAFGEVLEPGSSALAIVWENSWAARLAAAVQGSKGEVVYMQRIPRESVQRAIAALAED